MQIAASATPADIDPHLESNYSLRTRHPEREQIYQDYVRRSHAMREHAGALIDVAFGPGSTSTLDLFLPTHPAGAPLLVFIHGGYWRALDKSIFSFIAKAYVEAGVAVAMPNYALAPHARVADIVDEVCLAIKWLAENGANRWRLDSGSIVVSGHSAGGHMAAYAASHKNRHKPSEPIRGCLCISGIFDLHPLLRTSINHDLRLTKSEALRLRISGEDMLHGPVLNVAGALETDGFKSQTLELTERCQAAGLAAESMLISGRNHFDVLSDLADPGHPLFQKALAFLGRSPA